MARHCYKCLDCLAVFFNEGIQRRDLTCACGGRTHWMGFVRRTRLVREESRCPCDTRCTDARGPACDCPCGGENHGTGKLVTVEVFNGAVPKAMNEPSLARREEYLAAVAAAEARIRARYGALVDAYRSGSWIQDRSNWSELNWLFTALRNARALRSHKTRLRALEEIAS